MTPQEHIESSLQKIKEPSSITKPLDKEKLAEAIFKLVMSKKFRKYSVNPEYVEHIRSAIELNVEQEKPIQFTLVFGGYKLWRLEESPEVDWAELFAMMYYANWVRPICEIYKPGVWFDFFSDDVIVPKLNNVSQEDTKTYLDSFNKLLDLIKSYLPDSLIMTLHRVGDQYKSELDFESDLETSIKKVQKNIGKNLPDLTEEQKATIELNVRLNPGQDRDPRWREKIQLIHDGYAQVSGRRPYYRTKEKIMVITRPIPNSIAVGTTKHSVMKFWVGVGVLKRNNGDFDQVILSPGQLAKTEFKIETINMGSLEDKNFGKIRVLI